ncbi:hypothetical protein [Nocardia concava]|uniref:hypothetical protein n=1 Tax=Nocardia concava TaxID=257281 RepID=UPI0002D8E314|nr:hypothetical protein [Nocardia concava]
MSKEPNPRNEFQPGPPTREGEPTRDDQGYFDPRTGMEQQQGTTDRPFADPAARQHHPGGDPMFGAADPVPRQQQPEGQQQPGVRRQPGERLFAEGEPGRAQHPGNGHTQADSGSAKLREQWREVQTQFVDDPKDAVTRADALVADALQQLTDRCSRRREELESRWARGDAADTEEMRQALRGYRELFDQLLGTASGATNM